MCRMYGTAAGGGGSARGLMPWCQAHSSMGEVSFSPVFEMALVTSPLTFSLDDLSVSC